MIRCGILLLAMGMNLAAADLVVDGLPLVSRRLLAGYHGVTLLPEDPQTWSIMKTLAFQEASLWARVDPESSLDGAWISQQWDVLERQIAIRSPHLVALLWLENRWRDQHLESRDTTSRAYHAWQTWTGTTLRALGQQIAMDQAKILPSSGHAESGVSAADQVRKNEFQQQFRNEVAMDQARKAALERKKLERNTSVFQRAAEGAKFKTDVLRAMGRASGIDF